MKLFPAIDIMDGFCVRLLYGNKDKVTIFGDPIEMAIKWEAEGASFLHVVDLNAAFSQKSNIAIIKKLVKAVKIPVQVGGGIRDFSDITSRLEDICVERVILGTSAARDFELVKKACTKYGDRVVAGIDCKEGLVAINGWRDTCDFTPIELAIKLKKQGIKTIIYTDISRDGALSGVNVEATADLQTDTGMQVIASGGVSSINDIRRLKECGVYGAILGKSIYTGVVNLKEAICLEKE